MKQNRCVLYPKEYEDKKICRAGADIGGIDNNYICSEQYSENCPWRREWERENGFDFDTT